MIVRDRCAHVAAPGVGGDVALGDDALGAPPVLDQQAGDMVLHHASGRHRPRAVGLHLQHLVRHDVLELERGNVVAWWMAVRWEPERAFLAGHCRRRQPV
jgi:hypothetical protein